MINKDKVCSSGFQKAFTLVELLVVCSIIGVLATIVSINVTSAQAKARDSRRMADLNTISKTVRLYYENNNSFPDNAMTNGKYCYFPFAMMSKVSGAAAYDQTSNPSSSWISGCLEGASSPTVNGLVTKNMVSALPADPNPSKMNYTYQNQTASGYALVGAELENGSSSPSTNYASTTVTETQCKNTTTNPIHTYYCVKVIP